MVLYECHCVLAIASGAHYTGVGQFCPITAVDGIAHSVAERKIERRALNFIINEILNPKIDFIEDKSREF